MYEKERRIVPLPTIPFEVYFTLKIGKFYFQLKMFFDKIVPKKEITPYFFPRKELLNERYPRTNERFIWYAF
jgi:hypothetical protein